MSIAASDCGTVYPRMHTLEEISDQWWKQSFTLNPLVAFFYGIR